MKLVLFFLCFSLLSGCAFIPHHDDRSYPVQIEKIPEAHGVAIKIYTSTRMDNVIGKIKNGLGTETADITVPKSRTDVLQYALEIELKAGGYQVKKEAPNALLARINQYEVELAQEGGSVGYYSICDLSVYLKTKTGLFERSVIATDKVTSIWAVTAKEGVDSFYKVTQDCAKNVVKLIGEKRL